MSCAKPSGVVTITTKVSGAKDVNEKFAEDKLIPLPPKLLPCIS